MKAWRNLRATTFAGVAVMDSPFHGVLGSEAAGSGLNGSGVGANDDLSAGVQYVWEATASNFSANGMRLYVDGSGEYTEEGTATLNLYGDNVLIGSQQLVTGDGGDGDPEPEPEPVAGTGSARGPSICITRAGDAVALLRCNGARVGITAGGDLVAIVAGVGITRAGDVLALI